MVGRISVLFNARLKAMKGRYVVTVITTVCASWLILFVIECYQNAPTDKHQHPRADLPPFPGTTMENTFWVLQLSDVHLSIVDAMETEKPLRKFCTETVSTIAPSLVMLTGDITHAKYADEVHSKQMEEEWKVYSSVLRETNVTEKVTWLDIRGNHDNFNVPSLTHGANHFRVISPSFEHHRSYSYRHVHTTPFGTYSFVSLDACPSPGPKRPYNFFGILNDDDIAALNSLTVSSRRDNHTIWFSHYPSSTITADRHSLRKLLSTATAHLCGHLHTLGGLVKHMYGRHADGHLELELADFRFTRTYRLLAFDHDLFSFTDAKLDHWPLVLITNPKDAHFLAPSHEPVGRIAQSSAIRVLAFSPHPIVTVRVWIDGVQLTPLTPVNGGPLYVSPWKPDLYREVTHNMLVTVKDKAGQETNVSQMFSVLGLPSSLDMFASWIILTDFQPLMKMTFLWLWSSLSASLVIAGFTKGSSQSYLCHLVQHRRVFYPWLSYVIYYGIGPWYLGELMTGHYGLVTVHGIIIGEHFLPGSMTYFNGFTHVLLFQLPFTFYLNYQLSSHSASWCSWFWHCIYIVIFGLLARAVFISPYGPLSVLISPGLAWPLPFSLLLAYWATHLHKISSS